MVLVLLLVTSTLKYKTGMNVKGGKILTKSKIYGPKSDFLESLSTIYHHEQREKRRGVTTLLRQVNIVEKTDLL